MSIKDIARELRTAADSIRAAQHKLEKLAREGVKADDLTPDVIHDLVYMNIIISAASSWTNVAIQSMIDVSPHPPGVINAAIDEAVRDAEESCDCPRCEANRKKAESAVNEAVEIARRG